TDYVRVTIEAERTDLAITTSPPSNLYALRHGGHSCAEGYLPHTLSDLPFGPYFSSSMTLPEALAIEEKSLEAVHGIIAVSRHMAGYIERFGRRSSRVLPLPAFG